MLLIGGCGSEQDKEQLEETSLDEILEKGEAINNDIKKAEQKWEKRRQKGDTLPVDFTILTKIMPNIDGWTKLNPEGMKIDADGTSYSSALQQYKSGNDELNISIFDYNGAIHLLAAATGWKATKMRVENEEGFLFAEPYNGFKDTWIYYEYNKINKNAIVILAINHRFVLTVNISGQENIDFAKKIAEQILNNNKELFSK